MPMRQFRGSSITLMITITRMIITMRMITGMTTPIMTGIHTIMVRVLPAPTYPA